jgi:ABC-2 type transport system ATP-binding protein
MERLRKYATIFYSTHILDDVQQVSDTVAILNKGELVAQAPLETLLAGSEGTVYEFELEGDTHDTMSRVAQQPWVSDLKVLSKNGRTRWQVVVKDGDAAKVQLLRMVVCDQGLNVLSFGQKKYELEEIFIRIVEGGAHGQHE